MSVTKTGIGCPVNLDEFARCAKVSVPKSMTSLVYQLSSTLERLR